MDSFLCEPTSVNDLSKRERDLGITLAKASKFRDAIISLNRALEIAPLDNLAKAYCGSCHYALGNKEEARGYLDPEESIYIEDCFCSPEFYRELSAYILKDSSLVWEPEAKATRLGYQSDELLHREDSIVKNIRKMIVRVLNDSIGLDLDNPDSNEALDLVGWSVVLSKQGYQDFHIHRSGILSGVLYVSIPKDLTEREGCLLFSQHLPWLPIQRSSAESVEYFLNAIQGRLVIFPSYYWHSTVPFDSSEKRISIAFDVTPANV